MIVAVPKGASSHSRRPLKNLEVVVFRSSIRVLCLAGSLASLAALPLGAQEKSTREPKDGATASKNRPNNARIVFGDLSEEAAKPPQKAASAPSNQRTNGWPNRLADPPRRSDTSPGIPAHPAESRQNDGGGVRQVNATTPVTRPPTSDSGPKRRP